MRGWAIAVCSVALCATLTEGCHNDAECMGEGICSSKGTCTCFPYWTGPNCQKSFLEGVGSGGREFYQVINALLGACVLAVGTWTVAKILHTQARSLQAVVCPLVLIAACLRIVHGSVDPFNGRKAFHTGVYYFLTTFPVTLSSWAFAFVCYIWIKEASNRRVISLHVSLKTIRLVLVCGYLLVSFFGLLSLLQHASHSDPTISHALFMLLGVVVVVSTGFGCAVYLRNTPRNPEQVEESGGKYDAVLLKMNKYMVTLMYGIAAYLVTKVVSIVVVMGARHPSSHFLNFPSAIGGLIVTTFIDICCLLVIYPWDADARALL